MYVVPRYHWASQEVLVVKNLLANAGSYKRQEFNPWVRKISWRRARHAIPVFLLGESPWIEEPGGLQFTGSQRIRHNWATKYGTEPALVGPHTLPTCVNLNPSRLRDALYETLPGIACCSHSPPSPLKPKSYFPYSVLFVYLKISSYSMVNFLRSHVFSFFHFHSVSCS